jgi:mRNA interferase MazF
MAKANISRGQIFFADIPKTAGCGSTFMGKRPILILSNNLNNKFSRTITGIPCSTKGGTTRIGNDGRKKKDLPTHVYIPSTKGGTGLTRDTIVMCENICNYSVDILEECIGEVDEEMMRKIEKAVLIQIGIIG